MDTLSHGLWTILLVKGVFNKGKLWLAFLFGIIPDIIPFGLPFIQMLFTGFEPRQSLENSIPNYVHTFYGITHSLIILFLVFLLIYAFKKKIYVWMLGWPLHILVDIPTHSKDFFPTPLFYPISDITIGGIRWSNPYIFFPNWILLITLIIIAFRKELAKFFKRFRKKINHKPS